MKYGLNELKTEPREETVADKKVETSGSAKEEAEREREKLPTETEGEK